MKNKLIMVVGILIALLVLLLGGTWVYRLLNPTVPTSALTPNPFGGLTASTTPAGVSTGSMELKTQDGSNVLVTDFIHSGETASDVENQGSYVLAGSLGYCLGNGVCPSGASTTEYNITYDSQYQSFNVALLKEPLGQSRLDAEQFLTQRLGISATQLCTLNYNVGTPYWVNQQFSGVNLGFSSCLSAVKLP
jgi:hypothetical protein